MLPRVIVIRNMLLAERTSFYNPHLLMSVPTSRLTTLRISGGDNRFQQNLPHHIGPLNALVRRLHPVSGSLRLGIAQRADELEHPGVFGLDPASRATQHRRHFPGPHGPPRVKRKSIATTVPEWFHYPHTKDRSPSCRTPRGLLVERLLLVSLRIRRSRPTVPTFLPASLISVYTGCGHLSFLPGPEWNYPGFVDGLQLDSDW